MITFKPIYRDPVLGELAQVPDAGIVNVGGTSSTTFTVGGRALLFSDGSSTSPGTDVGISLQAAYNNSPSPAAINAAPNKSIVFNAVNNLKFLFNSNTGAVSIDGNLTLGGTLNNTAVADIIGHINGALTPAKHTAQQISVDATTFSSITGNTVQSIIQSVDQALTQLNISNAQGVEYVQPTPSISWVINHGKSTLNAQVMIWDETNSAIIPDTIVIVNANVINVTFSSPQAGRAILVLF